MKYFILILFIIWENMAFFLAVLLADNKQKKFYVALAQIIITLAVLAIAAI